MFGPAPSGQRRACSVAHQYSSSVSPFHAYTGTPDGASTVAVRADDDRGRGVVLGGEDVAGRPAHLCAERRERLDQDRGLDRHMQRPGNPRTGERLAVGVLGADRHQPGHFVLGQADLVAAELGQREIGHLEVGGSQ